MDKTIQGAGNRFAKEGYIKPKPFIDALGKPMNVRVLENLKFDDIHGIGTPDDLKKYIRR